jgi:hypothetical protein
MTEVNGISLTAHPGSAPDIGPEGSHWHVVDCHLILALMKEGSRNARASAIWSPDARDDAASQVAWNVSPCSPESDLIVGWSPEQGTMEAEQATFGWSDRNYRKRNERNVSPSKRSTAYRNHVSSLAISDIAPGRLRLNFGRA